MAEKKEKVVSEKVARHFSNVKKRTVFALLGILLAACGLLYCAMNQGEQEQPVDEQTTLPVAVSTTQAAGTQPASTAAAAPGTTNKTAAPTTGAAAESTTSPMPAEIPGDWKLLLVNNSHPLPDNFPVSVRELPNGQAVDERVYPFLKKMLEDARTEGLQPVVCSSYRTKDFQTGLYNNKVKEYEEDGFAGEEAMARAAAWVATPGTSEHQAGLSVDIVDIDNQNLNETQETTPVSLWMKENCAKYGFILRYPTEKSQITGVSYEPWHYRYVGVEAAQKIMENGITLEEYLGQAAP